MDKSLANIRKEYGKRSLSEKDVSADPFLVFGGWFDEAVNQGEAEPNAMALSTVSEKGFPSSRMVLLKDWDSRGFVFFTNYRSRKGRHLGLNPNASLLFFWSSAERQVRIEGRVTMVTDEESDLYFLQRPPASRIGAIVSPQSEVIPDRAFLETAFSNYTGSAVRPGHWGGYRLVPVYFEFWQGRPDRLHDRISYCIKEDGHWTIHRLAP